MIRRNQGHSKSTKYDSEWDHIERRILSTPPPDWDGIERRTDGQIMQTKPEKQTNLQRWIFGGGLTSICLTLLGGGWSYFANIHNRLVQLEYNQTTMNSKYEDLKVGINDIKTLIKEGEKRDKSLEQQMTSLEDTVTQIYRKK